MTVSADPAILLKPEPIAEKGNWPQEEACCDVLCAPSAGDGLPESGLIIYCP